MNRPSHSPKNTAERASFYYRWRHLLRGVTLTVVLGVTFIAGVMLSGAGSLEWLAEIRKGHQHPKPAVTTPVVAEQAPVLPVAPDPLHNVQLLPMLDHERSREATKTYPTDYNAKTARQQLVSQLDPQYPGRGVIDYPGYPVGDNPKGYAMILKAEMALAKRLQEQRRSEVASTCGFWLLDHADLNNDQIIGWGLPSAWDAYGDGTENPAHTSYTISTAIAIDALLDWLEFDPGAPRERIIETVRRSMEPYFEAKNISPSGLASYSLSGFDQKYNCFNPAIYLAGQAQRFAQIVADESLQQKLEAFADRNVQAAVDSHVISPTGAWYWTYSLEEDTPNDIPHASYIIYGLQEYSRFNGNEADQLNERAILAHLRDFQHTKGIEWSAWPPFFARITPHVPRCYGLGMAIHLAAQNGMEYEANSMVKLLSTYVRRDGVYRYRPGEVKAINEYQAYAYLGLSYYYAYTVVGDEEPADMSEVVIDEQEVKPFRTELVRTDISKPQTIPFVELSTGDRTYRVEIEVDELATKLIDEKGKRIALPNRLAPLGVIDCDDNRLLVAMRHLETSELSFYSNDSKGWAKVASPTELNDDLFRTIARIQNDVVLVTYDAALNKNFVRRFRITPKAIALDEGWSETLQLKAYLGYEHQPRLLTVNRDEELLLLGGPCVARYSPSNSDSEIDSPVLTTEYLAEDERILEVAADEIRMILLTQAGNRSDHLNKRGARAKDPATDFRVIDFATGEEVVTIPLGSIPYNLKLAAGKPSIRFAETVEDLATIFRRDVLAAKAGGMMSLGLNNREGEMVWSQGYWLTGMIDMLTATEEMAGDEVLTSLRPKIKQRLDIEMALLDRMLMTETGFDCRVFSVNREPRRFAVQSGKTLLLLKRYLYSPEPLPLASYKKFELATANLDGHIEEFARNEGEESELRMGRAYLRWPKGCAFKYDGVGIPFNHQNCWAAGVLYKEAVTQLKKEQLQAAQDISFHVFDMQGFRQKVAQRDYESGREDAYHWHYWWGRARDGWDADADISANTPQWQGDGEYVALNRYRTFDAIAMLAAAKRFPGSMPPWMLNYLSAAVEDEGLEMFLIPYLAMVGEYPEVDAYVASYYLRVDSQPDFRNAFWAYRVMAENLKKPYVNDEPPTVIATEIDPNVRK